MKKLLKLVLALALMPSMCWATGELTGTYNNSASGTTSATIFVPTSSEFTNIQDLGFKLDSGVTSGQVIFRSGEIQYNSTSATSASGTTVWFANTGTPVTAGEFIIVQSGTAVAGAGQYFLRQVTVAAATSVTVSQSISAALTTSDLVWSVVGSVSRPVPSVNSASAAVSIWLPARKPTAITVDGNTTACTISASGIRTNYR